MKNRGRKVFENIAADVVLAGVGLVIFALFHHALPKSYSVTPKKITAQEGSLILVSPASEKNESIDNKETKEEKDYLNFDSEISDQKDNKEGENNPEGDKLIENAQESGNQTESKPVPEEKTEVEPEPKPENLPVITENSYQSENIQLQVNKVQKNGVTYYVIDVKVKDLSCFRTAFANDQYGRGITESVPEMAERNLAIAAINGDYYGTHANSGVVVRNGELYRCEKANGDVCILNTNGELYGISQREFNYGKKEELLTDAWQAWCFGPILLSDGKVKSGFTGFLASKNPRSGIGFYEPGHYCFVTVDGRQNGYSTGMTLTEFAELFKDLGCEFAYNLDGGKSANMTFQGELVNQPTEGGREISDIIFITERKEGEE